MYKILVAVDGSECALRALAAAVDRALESAETTLHLLTVYVPGDAGDSTALSHERVRQLAAAHGEWILRDAESRLPASGLKLTKEVLEGEPAETITRRAAETRSDVIFLGAHGIGHGGAPGGNVGSVAARVLELARPPVRLIR